jgi:hypothetical protein
MSRINQYLVATATFSVALGIGFVMQNGDALAARFAETPAPTIPATDLQPETVAFVAPLRALPREGTAAWLVQQRIETGVTSALMARAATGADMVLPAAVEETAILDTAAADAQAEEMLIASVALVDEMTPSLALPDPGFAPTTAAIGFDLDVTLLALPTAPVLQASLDVDAMPEMPAPDAPGTAPDCGVTLFAAHLPAALVELDLAAPCSPSARATIHHQGMIFTVVTDASGAANVTVPALAESAVFMADLGEGGGAVAVVTVPDLAEFDRAVLQWQGTVGPEIHALEFGAGYGDAGHVWHGAPRAADAALAGTGGFLMRLGDGAGLNPHMAEVYTYPSGASRQSGEVTFTVEAVVTDDTCGRDLAAQTIQVSPGAEPFAFDLIMSVPDCEFIGEILVMKDMILGLTVAER